MKDLETIRDAFIASTPDRALMARQRFVEIRTIMKRNKANSCGEARTPDGRRARTDGIKFLCPSQVAARWGWNTESVRRAIRQGRIGSVIISRRRLVPVAEVERIESQGTISHSA